MNKRFTKTLLAGLIAGAGIMSAGNLVASAYDTDDPSPVETTVESPDESTDATPQGLIAQVETDTDTPVDEPADPSERNRGPRGGGCGNEAVAEVLGLTVDELDAERAAGNSLADIATEVGVAVDDVVEAIVSEKSERIAEKVAAGDITQAEADEKLADLEARTVERVNRNPGE